MSTSPPLVVADRYRLVAPLGQGGMGRVWRATDVVLHRDVAIKELVPPPGLTPDERQEMRERSLREARAIARLNNINVVRVFDVLRTDADPWIVMEYVPSRSLQDILAGDGPLPPVRAAEVGLGVLNALRAAHRNGVVHRDVKPGNVLIGEDGRVVLTDFGLATVPGDPNVTRTGLVLGSPAYIAPERARDGTAGPGADLWSLGATLYAAVEGASPFARPSAIATLAALATENPPPARNAGPLKPVLNGLLRKDPAHRINAEEAERLLLRATGRRSKLTFPMSPTMRRPGVGRERPALPGTPPVIPGSSSVSGSAPVVPGPRPPVSTGRPPAAADRPPAQSDDRRPTVFIPGKASVGRAAAEKPPRLDATRVDTPPVRDNPSGTGNAAPQTPVRPGPEVTSAPPATSAHGALSRGTRGAFGTISAAEVAAHRRRASGPNADKPAAPAASAAAPVAERPAAKPAADPEPSTTGGEGATSSTGGGAAPAAAPSRGAPAAGTVHSDAHAAGGPIQDAESTSDGSASKSPTAAPAEQADTAASRSTPASAAAPKAADRAPVVAGASSAEQDGGKAAAAEAAAVVAEPAAEGEAEAAADHGPAAADAPATGKSEPTDKPRPAGNPAPAGIADLADSSQLAGKPGPDRKPEVAEKVETAGSSEAADKAAASGPAASEEPAGSDKQSVPDKAAGTDKPAAADRAADAQPAADDNATSTGAAATAVTQGGDTAGAPAAPAKAVPNKPAVGARAGAGKSSRKKGRGRITPAAKAAPATTPTALAGTGAPAGANAATSDRPAASGAPTRDEAAATGDKLAATSASDTPAAGDTPPGESTAGDKSPAGATGEGKIAAAAKSAEVVALLTTDQDTGSTKKVAAARPGNRKVTTASVTAAKSTATTADANAKTSTATESPAGTAVIGVPAARTKDTSTARTVDGTRVLDTGAAKSLTGGVPSFPGSSRPAWQPMAVPQRPASKRGVTIFGTALTRRQTVVGAAILAAVLLALVLLVPKAFGGDAGDGNRGAGPAVPPASAQVTATTTAPAAAPPPTATQEPTTAAPSSPAAPATTTAAPANAAPKGFYIYRDSTGFSVPVPNGWRADRRGSEVYFQDDEGGRLLIIDQTDQPKDDPVADWRQQEADRRGRTYRDYQAIRLEAVPDYFVKAADWEFLYTTTRGNRQHAQKRGFVTSPDQAYGISWYTSPQDWDANKSVLETIYNGFKPAKS